MSDVLTLQLAGGRHARSQLSKTRCRRRAGQVGIGITEYGLSWRTPSFRHLADFTAALWTADVAGRIMAGRAELAHYFALQDTGGHGLLDSAGFIRPTYHVFRLLRDFHGSVVPVLLQGAPPTLSVYAVAGDDGTLRILAVNMDSRAGARLRMELPDGIPLLPESVRCLTEASFEQHDDAEEVPPAPALLLPPRSVTVVTVRS